MNIDVNVNKISSRTIGVMGKDIYKDDELVLELKEILESNNIRLPSNITVNKNPSGRVNLDPHKFNMISMKAYGKFMCYRQSFAYKKVSTEMADCINKIYYFVGIYNMLSHLGIVQHTLNYDKRNLMLQSSYRSYFWERTNSHVLDILNLCSISNKGYKESIENFFKHGEANDYYLGAFFYTINLPYLTPDIYNQLGFLKVKVDKYKDIYLLPSYLLPALNPEDRLVLLNNANDNSLYEEKNMPKFIIGKQVNLSYIPYYKDEIHILYGFEVHKYKKEVEPWIESTR